MPRAAESISAALALTALVAGALQDRPARPDRGLTVPEGFEVDLVAGPPLVDRPIVADFDEEGRLYVADSSGSNDKVEKQLADKPHRIVRLEDTEKKRQCMLVLMGATADGHKELIAVGISVVMDCESCMQWHIEQAIKAGANQQEVLEAIEVGMEMGGGRATVSARFALEVMETVCGTSPK